MAANINAFEIFAKIGADTSPLKTGLNSAKGLVSGFGKTAGSAFKSLSGTVAGVFKSLSGKLAGFFKQAREKAAEFEQSMAQVAATMGKTVDEMDADVQTITRKVVRDGQVVMEEFTGNLREYALQLGSETKFTSAQVGEAMNYMALAGYDTVTTMEMLPSVLNLAAAGAMELGRASDVVTDVQTAFGISTERTSQMIDEMAKAASTGNTSVAQLGDAFLTVGGLAKNVGHGFAVLADGTKVETDNVQEITTALVAMANAGVKGSEAGMHMRNMLLKLSSPTDKGAEQLEELGVKAFDASGNMRSLREIFSELSDAMSKRTTEQNLQTMSELFNARDITSAQALLSAIESTSWDKIATAVLDSEGAAERMSKTLLSTTKGAQELYKSALDNFMIAVSESTNFGGAQFAQLFRFGADALSALTKALKEGGWEGFLNEVWVQADKVLDKIITQAPEKITDMLAKLPQLIIAVLPKLMQAATKMLTKLTDAISGKGDGGGMASKLKALPSRIMAMWTGSIKQNGPALMKAVGNLLETVGTAIVNNLPTIAAKGAQIANSIVEGIANIPFDEVIPHAIKLITTIAKSLTDENTLGNLLSAGNAIISKIADGMFSDESLNAFFDPETGAPKVITNLIDGIKTFLVGDKDKTDDGLFGTAASILSKLADWLADPDNKDKLREGAEGIIEHLGELLVDLWEEGMVPFVTECCHILGSLFVDNFDYEMTAWEIIQGIGKTLAEKATSFLNPAAWIMNLINGTDIDEAYQAENTDMTGSEFKKLMAVSDDENFGYYKRGSKEYLQALWTATAPPGQSYENFEYLWRMNNAADPAGNIDSYVNKYGTRGVPIFGNGGIVDRPTLAVVGDDGREAIVPLDKDSAIGRRFGGVSISFGNIYVQGGKNAGQEVVRQIDEALRIYQIQQGRGIGATGY